MTCPHRIDGCCRLSALLAKQELEIELSCPVSESHCGRCLARGVATEDAPTLEVLGNVFTVCPATLKPKWRAYRDFVTIGKPRGRGDKVAKVLQAPLLKPLATAGKKLLGAFGGGDCGCKKRQKQMNEKHPSQSTQSSIAAAHEKPG